MSIEGRFRLDRGSFKLDVEFNIPGRGVTALFGRSGSGKTALLRCLAGLEQPPGARLVVNGECWQGDAFCLPIHRRALGFVFQESSLFAHLNVRRNLLFGYRRVAPAQRRVNLDDVVTLLGLESLLDRFPDALSGGQRQRVAIGRALLTSPRLLLMDEPIASLDAVSKAEILPYLERLHMTLDIPVVYVSHIIDEVVRLADHMVLLDEGRVLAQGSLQELLIRSDLPLAHSENASAVMETTVLGHDDRYHLTELQCSAGRLLVSRQAAAVGDSLRVRVRARDITIALSPPRDSSVLNCLAMEVDELSDDPHPGHVLVRLAAGEQRLISRITRRSCEHLALRPGAPVYALVKGVAIN